MNRSNGLYVILGYMIGEGRWCVRSAYCEDFLTSLYKDVYMFILT